MNTPSRRTNTRDCPGAPSRSGFDQSHAYSGVSIPFPEFEQGVSTATIAATTIAVTVRMPGAPKKSDKRKRLSDRDIQSLKRLKYEILRSDPECPPTPPQPPAPTKAPRPENNFTQEERLGHIVRELFPGPPRCPSAPKKGMRPDSTQEQNLDGVKRRLFRMIYFDPNRVEQIITFYRDTPSNVFA